MWRSLGLVIALQLGLIVVCMVCGARADASITAGDFGRMETLPRAVASLDDYRSWDRASLVALIATGIAYVVGIGLGARGGWRQLLVAAATAPALFVGYVVVRRLVM